jgi:hypothetical protein
MFSPTCFRWYSSHLQCDVSTRVIQNVQMWLTASFTTIVPYCPHITYTLDYNLPHHCTTHHSTQTKIFYLPKFQELSIFNQWHTQEFCSGRGGVSTNSVEDRGQSEWGSGGSSPLVRGSAQFSNERNPYSY